MGCWNETCNLTNLPIMYGDEIVVYATVALDSGHGRHYYGNDGAVPFIMPIYGTYDEYGGIENAVVDKLTQRVIENTVFYSLEKNWETDEEKFVPVKLTVEEFVKDFTDDSLYIKISSSHYEYSLIHPCFFHRGAFEAVVNEVGSRKPYNQEQTYSTYLYNYTFEIMNKCVDGKKEAFDLANELAKKYPDDHELSDFIAEGLYDRDNPLFGEDVYGIYNFGKPYKKEVCSKSDIELISKLWADYMCFKTGMNYLRKGFYINSGLGSQCSEMKLHCILANWILKHFEECKEEEKANGNDIEDFGAESIWAK